MDDAVIVRILERVTNLRHDRQCFPRSHPLRIQHLAQVQPVDVLHHKKVQPVRLPEVVDRDDVRMIESGHRLGFTGESFGEVPILADLRRQDFECHESIEPSLPRFVNGPHPTATEKFQQLQIGKAGRESGGFRRHPTRGAPVSAVPTVFDSSPILSKQARHNPSGAPAGNAT